MVKNQLNKSKLISVFKDKSKISELSLSPVYAEPKSLLFNNDAFKVLEHIKDKSIDLICTDLPYGVTQNKWDEILPLDKMWAEFNRIIKDNGAVILTATQPFASKLICSNLDNFKYDIIWQKTVASGQLNVKKMPLRVHEHILVFYKKLPTYNEQKTQGDPYKIRRDITENANYGKQKPNEKINDGYRHARSVVEISNPRIKGGHPTQKPISLMDYIIKTFTNENEIVLDCCLGSGTTGVSAKGLNRQFIGVELDNNYYKVSIERISNLKGAANE